MWRAIDWQQLPGRLIYGANYVMRSYHEIEEVEAAIEIREELRAELKAKAGEA